MAASGSNLLPQLAFLGSTAAAVKSFTIAWTLLLAVQAVVRSSVGERALYSDSGSDFVGSKAAKTIMILAFLASFAFPQPIAVALLLAPSLSAYEVERYRLLRFSQRQALARDLSWLVWSAGLAALLGAGPIEFDASEVLRAWIIPGTLFAALGSKSLSPGPITADSEGSPTSASALAIDASVAAALGYLVLVLFATFSTDQVFAQFRAAHLLAGPLVVAAPSLSILLLRDGPGSTSLTRLSASIACMMTVWYGSVGAILQIWSSRPPNLPAPQSAVFVMVAAWQIFYAASSVFTPAIRHSGRRRIALLRLRVGALLLAPCLVLVAWGEHPWLLSYAASAAASFLVVARMADSS